MSDEEMFRLIAREIQATFGIDPTRVTLDADLRRDLDIDSIDAVDLAVRLQALTGRKVPPEAFRSIRTVRDVIRAIGDGSRD
jgi:acyl carrier protein